MNSTLRFGTAMSAVLLAAALAACAGPSGRSASNFGRAENFAGKPDTRNIGLATRAQAALLAEQPAVAIDFAERAVAGSPNDAGFRGLLGNAYFAGGRFASAEAAYRDSLTLLSNQPQVVLKLVLVSVAQGKNDQALSFLDAAKNVIDPSDYGLALALAGQPQQAAQSLQQAAQAVGADSRVRQNLALALALSGDWTGARTVAAQDVPADQLDARIQSWMQLAKPARASDQVASLTGITPAAVDLGQPVRLALKDAGTRLAALAPVVEPAPALVSAPVETAVATTAVPALVVAVPVAMRTRSAPDYVAASLTPKAARVSAAPRPSLSPRAAALTDARALYRRAALTTGQVRSRAVVQLGAFASRGSVTAAWRRASTRFTTLRGYTPLAARFDGERGTVYRLSVQGFGSARQAFDLCGSLKRAGAACFVRNVAGDAPVQIASR
ncbi:tetratricopeptide repeat protein [Sphingomonas sp.]|uniref:SPOR domain-containing protein n=1 Tax=Sphingomonas sp. TaxID=28214 RepID=UPI00325FBC57